MAKLTSKTRNALPSGTFALPGRRYPIEDAAHARNALARGAQNATPAEQATIRAKVAAKYPGITQAQKKSTRGSPAFTSSEIQQGYRCL